MVSPPTHDPRGRTALIIHVEYHARDACYIVLDRDRCRSQAPARPHQEPDLVGAEADRRIGRITPGSSDDVVELLDHALDHQPVLDVAGGEVDHGEVAERADALARQPLVEREAVEGAVLARAGDADDRVVAEEGEAAGEALQNDDAALPGAGRVRVRLPPPQARVDQERHVDAHLSVEAPEIAVG